MWWLAIQNAHENANINIVLDYDEAIAVYAYTNCIPPFYEKINSALRAGEDYYLVPLIDSALQKLPIHTSTVVHRWTDMSEGDIGILTHGGVFLNAGYTSTNMHSRRYDGAGFDCESFRIFMHTGRNISLYSDDFSFQLEEILIPRNASFRMLGRDVIAGFSFDLIQV